MERELHYDYETLGDQLLMVYTRAVFERKLGVAEELLGAIEELARSDPACCVIVERAYELLAASAFGKV